MTTIAPLTREVLDTIFPCVVSDIIFGYFTSADRGWYSIAEAGEYETCLSEDIDVDPCFHGACSGGHLPIVRLMLQFQPICIDLGITTACDHDHLDVVAHILAVYQKHTGKKPYLDMAMRAAALSRSTRVVNMLADLSADTVPTGIYSAASAGHMDIINTLMLRNVPYSCQRALECACQNKNAEIVEMMLGRFSNVDLESALAMACIGGNMQIVIMLIKRGAQQRDQPLGYACGHGNTEAAAYLISAGATKCNNWSHCHDLIDSSDIR